MDWLAVANILIDHLRGVPKATTFLRQARNAGRFIVATFIIRPHSAAVMLKSAVRGEDDDEFNH